MGETRACVINHHMNTNLKPQINNMRRDRSCLKNYPNRDFRVRRIRENRQRQQSAEGLLCTQAPTPRAESKETEQQQKQDFDPRLLELGACDVVVLPL